MRGAVLVLVLVQMVPATAVCPAQCLCNHTALTVSCESGRLEHFPIQLNPRVQRLDLAGNRITRLHGSIDYYTGLVSLNLSSNAVERLDALTFEHQRLLQDLDLASNRLELVARGSLAGLRRLRRLSLADNRLVRLDDGALGEAHHLQRLDLSGNRLRALGGALSGLARLQALSIGSNRLARVRAVELRALTDLRELGLCHNGLQTLQGAEQLPELRWLDLSGNRLTTLPDLSALTKLSHLDVSANRLSRLAAAAPSTLRWLDLSANRLSRLRAADLAGLPHLRQLRLCDSAQLREVAADALSGCPQLHTLQLCNNSRLARLPDRLLVATLRRVSVRDCRLSALPAPAAAANLSWLDARGNQLSCNCSLRWLQEAVAAGRAADLRCAGPGSVSGRRLSLLATAELWCPPPLAPLALSLGLPLLVLALLGGAFCALCRRRRSHRTATAGVCVATLAQSHGTKGAAAAAGGGREWPRYWPCEVGAPAQHGTGKLHTAASVWAPRPVSAEPRLVLSADSFRGYSSDEQYSTSIFSCDDQPALALRPCRPTGRETRSARPPTGADQRQPPSQPP
ncbi:chondroadherin-like protein [Amphibalanus amphitrite]|uniref:chondroadherin-like protein n=1 Tax=Amphibalanus amphitrite TaxID=1232801 RepID=UPI001C906774|nr:chondroadherin-like protein [Amphibalanus amphitrite]